MHAFSKIRFLVMIALGMLYACGGAKPAATGAVSEASTLVVPGQVDLLGALDGRNAAWKDVAFGLAAKGSGQQLVVVASDTAGLCSAINNGTANNSNLLIIRIADASGQVGVGPHPITAQGSTASEQVSVTVGANGFYSTATGGNVVVSYVALDSNSPTVLVLNATDGNSTLSGSISAPSCTALEIHASDYP